MATLLTMPAIVADATSAFLASWLKNAGEDLRVGEPLAEIETDKATVEYEAEVAGHIAQLLVEVGTEVPVGAPIAVLTEPGEGQDAIDAALAAAGLSGSDPVSAPLAPVDAETTPDTPPAVTDGPGPERLFSSPLARRLAREAGIGIHSLTGSGPNGRIVRTDVQAAIAAGAVPTQRIAAAPVAGPVAVQPRTAQVHELPAGSTRVELTRMRQAIARRLGESKSTVPHFYLAADVQVDELFELRRRLNEHAPRKITVNDLIVKAIARSLMAVPEANAIWSGDSITRFDHADISVAIATPTGLLTPVVRHAEKSALATLSETIADYAQRAQENRIRPEELAGGSFTVSNLGMYGTKEFSAILNPPQAGILAVGVAEQRPVVRNGELAVATVMTCTLSADHRVVDGAVAATLMSSFKDLIENPLALVL